MAYSAVNPRPLHCWQLFLQVARLKINAIYRMTHAAHARASVRRGAPWRVAVVFLGISPEASEKSPQDPSKVVHTGLPDGLTDPAGGPQPFLQGCSQSLAAERSVGIPRRFGRRGVGGQLHIEEVQKGRSGVRGMRDWPGSRGAAAEPDQTSHHKAATSSSGPELHSAKKRVAGKKSRAEV